MLEFNVTVSFPAAPLLTVILALVGKCLYPYHDHCLRQSHEVEILTILQYGCESTRG